MLIHLQALFGTARCNHLSLEGRHDKFYGMKKRLNYYTAALLLLCSLTTWANTTTKRISLLDNNQVNVWKTIIYPSRNQQLKMHRHEFNRVLIALNDGELKIVNDHGNAHYLKLKKEQAYFLNKDIQNELHTDENISGHLVKVVVVEIKP